MNLKTTTQLTVDFQDKKYISLNAKQYDKKSRFILVTCCNQGSVFPIDSASNVAYIRYRKADDLGVFNSCKITEDGKILIELTEQMLAVAGKCYADLVILSKNADDTGSEIEGLFDVTSTDDNNGNVTLDTPDSISIEDDNNGNASVVISDLGELITDGTYSILSTMQFCINVIEGAIDNIQIESSYEFDALNELLVRAEKDYADAIATCQAYKSSAKLSADNADKSESNAKTSELNAKMSEENALTSETNAKASEIKAKESKGGAIEAEADAEGHAQSAQKSAEESRSSAEEASESANAAEVSKMSSLAYQITARSYAVGGTGQRIDEDTDNAKYYYTQTKSISDNLGGVFAPMGTIEFSQLQSVEKSAGYVYHITDAFVSDDTFKAGAGVSYPAGTSVYYTADGYWDCISGKFISDAAFNTIMDTIKDLQGRIEELENQVVLGITE